ncbi:MAG TPA: UDP-N-acetylmuramoyl-L-alanine--D-glutamate ligase [Candidatus Latescibacteria bacterium]|nr:UDP-N-acetylmuramoyl-L-alanine--D-glutamate ligase [Candidatus Latescibacterota bacterium]
MDLRGRKVTVMGLGLFGGGLGVTCFLVSKGAQVTVTDLRGEKELKESLEALSGLPVKLKLGGHEEADFRDTDMVVVNPAVPKDSPYLKIARDNGVPIETEMNLFFKLCKSPIIGVTGTNGKTTTVALIGEMLRKIEPRTPVGGNIGGSMLDRLDDLSDEVPVVLELSSFQLEDLQTIHKSPHIAVVTNLTPNHLDRHGTIENYIKAKKGIILNQTRKDVAILNYDDTVVSSWKKDCKGDVLFFSLQHPVDRGAYIENDQIVVGEERICRTEELLLPGRHSLSNALAAVTVAWLCKVDSEAIAGVLRGFKALEHRLEFVREVSGVKYYNDSIATTPEATIAALNTVKGGIILIAGGSDKGLSYVQLARIIVERVKSLLLIGETADQIARLVKEESNRRGRELKICRCASLEEAVRRAEAGSQRGDTVVMSPACASYDMFRNFDERGKRFKGLVWQL